jgi:hypothetical protein
MSKIILLVANLLQFGAQCRIFLWLDLWFCSLTLKMEASYLSETSVPTYKNTRYQNPEGDYLNSSPCPEWCPNEVLAKYVCSIWLVLEMLGSITVNSTVHVQLTASSRSQLHTKHSDGCAFRNFCVRSLNTSNSRVLRQPIDLITNPSLGKKIYQLFSCFCLIYRRARNVKRAFDTNRYKNERHLMTLF